MACPDPLVLARFLDGALEKSLEERVESHAVDCAPCAHRLAEQAYAIEEESRAAEAGADHEIFARAARQAGWLRAPAAVRLPGKPRRWTQAGWAAAAFLAAAGPLLLVRSYPKGTSFDSAPIEASAIPAGMPIRGAGEAFHTPAGRQEFISLAEGTRLRVGEESRVRFETPAFGERILIRIEQGTLEADVAKGKGAFRIVSDAGEIQVLGTHFKVRAFILRGSDVLAGFPSGPALYVQVKSGEILLRGAQGEIRVPAGSRGTVFPDAPPILQEHREGWQPLLDRFAQTLKWDGERPSLPPGHAAGARLMAAAFWGNFGEAPGDCAALNVEFPPRREAAAALLARLVSE